MIRGEDEAARGAVAVKDLRRGEQFEIAESDLARALVVEREQLRAVAASHRANVLDAALPSPSADDRGRTTL